MAEKICWSINGIIKADAQKVYKEIGNTKVTPKELVEKARNNVNSELHKCFEWDDRIASEKYRIIQAERVIRMLVVTREDKKDTPKIRQFQITSERNVYQPTRLFIENKSEYEVLLARAKEELKAFRLRYKQLSELEEIFNSIDAL